MQCLFECRACEQDVTSLHAGSLVFQQRFGSASNFNRHFYALVLDGACSCASGQLAPRFHAALPLEDEHVAELAAALRRRVTRQLEHRGRLPREIISSACLSSMLPAGTIGAGSTLVIHPTFDIPDRPVAASLFPPQAICVDTSGQATPWAPVQVQLLEWPAGRRFVSGDQESRYGPARRGKRSVNASGSSLA